MKSEITKVTAHISHNEALIFERSQTGRVGYRLPPLDVEEKPIEEIIPAEFQREDVTANDFVRRADERLYDAKRQGKNRYTA